jgi:ACT domain-containing protein
MNRAIIDRLFSFLLCILLVLPSSFAESLKVEVVSQNEKTVKLAERMESYGYYKSALHYYKMLEQQTNLSIEERAEVENKIKAVQQKLDNKYAKNNLPDLDEMLHVENVATEPAEQVSLVRPESFPKTRINKKKWFIGAAIVIGVGIIAYAVNRNLRKKKSNESTVVVEF